MVRYDIWYADVRQFSDLAIFTGDNFSLMAINHFDLRSGTIKVEDCFTPECYNFKRLGGIEVAGDKHLLSDHFPVSTGHYKVGLKFDLDED